MGDKDAKTLLQEASDLTKTKPGSALNTWKNLVRVIAIGIPVLGAIPTAYNLYLAYKHDVPLSEVSHIMAQSKLWKKNWSCDIEYQALNTGQGTRVDVGACHKTGDMLVKVSTNEGVLANQEWIPYEDIRGSNSGFSVFSSLIRTANAAEGVSVSGPRSKPGRRVAELGMKVVCQKLGEKGLAVRIVKEKDKCFKEKFSIFRGTIDGREEVPCETTCNGETKS